MRSTLFALIVLHTCSCGAKAPPATTPPAASTTAEPRTTSPSTPCAPTLVGNWTLTWYEGQDELGPNGEQPIGMALNYTFAPDGTYTMDGYPPISERGRYTVTNQAGNTMLVHFSDRISDGSTADKDVTYTFSECANKASIPGKIFTRTVVP